MLLGRHGQTWAFATAGNSSEPSRQASQGQYKLPRAREAKDTMRCLPASFTSTIACHIKRLYLAKSSESEWSQEEGPQGVGRGTVLVDIQIWARTNWRTAAAHLVRSTRLASLIQNISLLALDGRESQGSGQNAANLISYTQPPARQKVDRCRQPVSSLHTTAVLRAGWSSLPLCARAASS